MAGRPKQRALVAELARRAAEMDTDDATPLDYVCDWVASGRTMLELSKDITDKVAMDITREMLSRYVYGLEEGAAEKVAAARQRGAHALVEDAKHLVDNSPETREGIAKAGKQAEIRTWLAERFDRASFGAPKQQAAPVTVNILHLDAMRQRVVASSTVTELLEAGQSWPAVGSGAGAG